MDAEGDQIDYAHPLQDGQQPRHILGQRADAEGADDIKHAHGQGHDEDNGRHALASHPLLDQQQVLRPDGENDGNPEGKTSDKDSHPYILPAMDGCRPASELAKLLTAAE